MVEARKLQKRMRSISKSKVVKKKIHVRGMRFATVNGDCCWEVRRSYHGGETKELWRAHTYYTPWSIRAISLIKCWWYVIVKSVFALNTTHSPAVMFYSIYIFVVSIKIFQILCLTCIKYNEVVWFIYVILLRHPS